MSYASGFMVGSSIGQAVYKMFHNQSKTAAVAAPGPSRYSRRGCVTTRSQTVAPTKKEKPASRFTCVSVLKGRRRYRVKDLVNNENLAQVLTEKLGQLPGIRSLRINTLTGSILVYGASEGVLDKLENFLRFRLFPNVVEGVVSAVNDLEEEKKEVATYLKAIQATMQFFSKIIFKKSRAFFDLRTLLAFFLTFRGLRKVVFMQQRPSGPQMLWWALSLLRGKK